MVQKVFPELGQTAAGGVHAHGHNRWLVTQPPCSESQSHVLYGFLPLGGQQALLIPAQHPRIHTPGRAEKVYSERRQWDLSSPTWPWVSQAGTFKQRHSESKSFSTDCCRGTKGECPAGMSLAYLHANSLYLKPSHKQMTMLETAASSAFHTHHLAFKKKNHYYYLLLAKEARRGERSRSMELTEPVLGSLPPGANAGVVTVACCDAGAAGRSGILL